jgi:hypothetical protein
VLPFPSRQTVMAVLALLLLLKLVTHVSISRYVIVISAARYSFHNMPEHVHYPFKREGGLSDANSTSLGGRKSARKCLAGQILGLRTLIA